MSRERRPLRWEALRQTFLGTKLDGYFGCMNACLTHNVEQRLSQVAAPTLVLAGSEDPTTPPEDNRLIASKISGARYAEIAGGYHFPNVEYDAEFNRIMLDCRSTLNAVLKRVNESLNPAERVRKFILRNEPFTIENGFVTPTQKIKRGQVIEALSDQIESIY